MSENKINLEEILKKELIPIVFAHSSEMTFLATLRAMNEEFEQRKKEVEARQEQHRQRELKQLAELKAKYDL